MRILIAEDEALIRMDLREMLEEEGHTVVGEARDGAEAISLAREAVRAPAAIEAALEAAPSLPAAHGNG